MFHRHDAFERVSRAMRAPGMPVAPTEIADMADLIEALDRLVTARAPAGHDDRDAGGTA